MRDITKSLTRSQDAREFLLKNSREVIILCSHSIISSHKGDLKSAKIKVQKADRLLKNLRKKALGNLDKYLVTPEQELVEAYSLLAIINKRKIPSSKILGVSSEAYVLGLLDCIGELKRYLYDKIRNDELSEALAIFDIMEELYQFLYPFATFDKIVREARRKIDVNRILLEESRAALTEEIRRTALIEAIKKIEK